ncbi:MAG: hypothetical protein MJE77_02470 [Proteobacteria bacterium]|nr:hypothetical protein [Pseudomonadota bacterium]
MSKPRPFQFVAARWPRKELSRELRRTAFLYRTLAMVPANRQIAAIRSSARG